MSNPRPIEYAGKKCMELEVTVIMEITSGEIQDIRPPVDLEYGDRRQFVFWTDRMLEWIRNHKGGENVRSQT